MSVHPRSYLHAISTSTVLDEWIADMWTYCDMSDMPDQVGYHALQIYAAFLNTKTPQYNKSVWVNHACMWIATKLFMDINEDASAYSIVRRVRVKRSQYSQCVKKLVKTEAKVARAVKFGFSQPLAIDFVIVLTKMLDIHPHTKKYTEITNRLKRNTCASSVARKPMDMAVEAMVSCDSTLKKAIDDIVLTCE